MTPEQFKQHRERLGLSQQALADKIEKSRRWIQYIEKGEMACPLLLEFYMRNARPPRKSKGPSS